MQPVHRYLSTLLVFAALAVPTAARAQFGEGQKYFGAHVGLSGVGSAAAFGVNGEVAYNERIGIGAWVDTWSYGQTYAGAFGSSSYSTRYIALAGTGSYHFPIESQPKLDPFVGVALGYYIVSAQATSGGFTASADDSRLFVGGFGGARYFFKDNLSGVARLGFGASYLTLGVDFKL